MKLSLQDTSGHDGLTGETLCDLTDVVAFLYTRLHLGPDVELAVTCVDVDHMEQLHLQWMGLPGPTDVLSFPMDELRPGTVQAPVESGTLGDIVLCPTVAQTQAHQGGHSLTDELCLLTTHGVLHLLGYDHHQADQRREMFGLQAALLEEFLGRPAPTPTVSDTPQTQSPLPHTQTPGSGIPASEAAVPESTGTTHHRR